MAKANTFAAVLSRAVWEEICLKQRPPLYLVKGGRRGTRSISGIDGIIFKLSNRARMVAKRKRQGGHRDYST